MDQNLLTYNGIVKFFENKLTGIYKCANIKTNTWYTFRNHRWNEMANLVEFYTMLNEICKNEIVRISKELSESADVKTYLPPIRNFNQIMQNQLRKNSIVRELADLLYDPEFLHKLDTNTKLICFTNGVYDLGTNTFRDGKPDDYISCGVNYGYEPNIGKNSELNMFFKQIQPDRELRKYLKKVFSKTLVGSTVGETFPLVGPGSNGKSSSIGLLSKTLGDLFGFVDSGDLPNTNASQIQFNQFKNIVDRLRACFVVSNCQCHRCQCRIIPDVTKLSYRLSTYDTMKYYSVLFMEMNCLEQIICEDEDDEGTWLRIKVIPFTSTFTKKEDSGENHFVAENVSKNFQNWRPYMMNKLIKYYNLNDVIPQSVADMTQKYRQICKGKRANKRGSCEIYCPAITNKGNRCSHKIIKHGVCKDHMCYAYTIPKDKQNIYDEFKEKMECLVKDTKLIDECMGPSPVNLAKHYPGAPSSFIEKMTEINELVNAYKTQFGCEYIIPNNALYIRHSILDNDTCNCYVCRMMKCNFSR
ncbi:MAG: D5-ATPase-helicase [Satyrvirus sp.]|uniref:D5-ATPase-helicase n=1 Tax=Satyrvirus sp. TaxID=2487771 RepID=A0A3G5AIC2_9VIRU|nr:MAG: D5-ATPase-helicase [Satyrvirus sp.]